MRRLRCLLVAAVALGVTAECTACVAAPRADFAGLVFFQDTPADWPQALPKGALVRFVLAGTGADKAGMLAGDLVEQIGGSHSVTNGNRATAAWSAALRASGDCVKLSGYRTHLRTTPPDWTRFDVCIRASDRVVSDDALLDLAASALPTIEIEGAVLHPGLYLLTDRNLPELVSISGPFEPGARACLVPDGPESVGHQPRCGPLDSIGADQLQPQVSYRLRVYSTSTSGKGPLVGAGQPSQSRPPVEIIHGE
jgi:hypothetical protein